MLKNIKKLVSASKKVLTASGLCALVLYGSFIQPSLHNTYLRYEVGESAVQVLLPTGGGGSGFAVKSASGKSYIMTNKHVCDGTSWVKIKSNQINAWKRVVYKDNIHDLCLVEGDNRLDSLTLGSSPIEGDSFYIVGYPGLRPLTISQGEYIGYQKIDLVDDQVKEKKQCTGRIQETSIFEKMFTGVEWICVRSYKSYGTTAVAYPGNSGSPVVNKYGNVVGVLFAGSTDEERDNFVVPLEQIIRVLAKF